MLSLLLAGDRSFSSSDGPFSTHVPIDCRLESALITPLHYVHV